MSGLYYQPLYLLLVTVCTLSCFRTYLLYDDDFAIYRSNKEPFSLFIVLFLILFIGLRPNWYGFIDSRNYINAYNLLEGLPFTFDHSAENLLFDNLLMWVASNKFGYETLFVFIATIYFGCAYWGIKRLFKEHSFVAFVVFLSAFSTFSYATNGIKAGAAASMFLLAISFRNSLVISTFFLFISTGIHHSMIVPVLAYLTTFFFKKTKYYFGGWLFSLFVAICHISYFQNLFASFSDEKAMSYLSVTAENADAYITGFRPDFILYSAMPVWVGYWAKFKKNIQSAMYDTLLYTYLTTNAVWLLCMYASFTNRIAYLSWGLYPVVLIYPFFLKEWGEDRYQVFTKVMVLHLAFTLFMEMIYYGGLMKLLF